MYDENAYIRVVNDTTNTVINYVKASLLIQRDSANRFLLKNDSFINYYNYTDVADPVSTDIDDLITTLTSWNAGQVGISGTVTTHISNTSVPVTIENTPIVSVSGTVPVSLPISLKDQFSRLKVSHPSTTILHINSSYDKGSSQIAELAFNNASSSYDPGTGTVEMYVTTDSNSRIIRQSKLYTQHVYGSTSTAVVSGMLIDNVSSNGVVSKIGVFDDFYNNDSGQMIGNGMFFEWNAGLNVVYRTINGGTTQDYSVAQADWNIDKFDGTGPSGINWNITNMQTFVFEWNQAIPGSAKLGIFGHRNDTNEDCIVWCHKFATAPKFSNPCLPIRWELHAPTSLSQGRTMVQGPATVYTTKQIQEPNVINQAGLGGNMVMLNSPSTKPLLSIRLRYGCERAKLKPRSMQIANIAGGGFGYWSLVLNPTLTGSSFTDHNTSSSYAAVDVSATAYSNGRVITSGYIYNASVQTIDLEDHDITLPQLVIFEGF
jgi:hypothetical protein